jgi:hypothetical protein
MRVRSWQPRRRFVQTRAAAFDEARPRRADRRKIRAQREAAARGVARDRGMSAATRAGMPTKRATKPPWKRARPQQRAIHLTAAEKARAKARARKAGRRYPNLVDNMAEARRKKGA